VTAIRARRTRLTAVAFAAGIVGVGAIGGLGYAGVDNLYDSRAGRIVSPESSLSPSQRLPYTPTALVGAVDDTGWLTSVAVLALEPDGTGGSIVSLSPSGDAATGNVDRLAPLNAVYVVDGPDALLAAVEGLTGMSFDIAEIVDAGRFADLTTPLGELVVELPTDLRDASSGERYRQGVTRMSPDAAGAAITSRDPAIEDWLLDPARAAVWDAIADAAGAGVGADDGVAVAMPATLDEFLTRLLAGRVAHRSMTFKEISATRVNEQLADEYRAAFGEYDGTTVTVVANDRAEILMVLGAIAPGRLGAPFEGPTVRVVARFDPEDLEPLGLNNSDVARQAINRLLFAKVNVVSFGQTESAPDVTVFEVADPSSVDGVQAAFGTVFGESQVRAADSVIEGVDIEITLGRAYLETVERAG
jgi:hypothetical protein